MTDRTEQQYEAEADAIATAIWEQSTGNGREVVAADWNWWRRMCEIAVKEAYRDGIPQADWQAAALAALTSDTLSVWTVQADAETGEWLGEPEDTGRRVDVSEWNRREDTDAIHFDTYVHDPETQAERAIEVVWRKA